MADGPRSLPDPWPDDYRRWLAKHRGEIMSCCFTVSLVEPEPPSPYFSNASVFLLSQHGGTSPERVSMPYQWNLSYVLSEGGSVSEMPVPREVACTCSLLIPGPAYLRDALEIQACFTGSWTEEEAVALLDGISFKKYSSNEECRIICFPLPAETKLDFPKQTLMTPFPEDFAFSMPAASSAVGTRTLTHIWGGFVKLRCRFCFVALRVWTPRENVKPFTSERFLSSSWYLEQSKRNKPVVGEEWDV